MKKIEESKSKIWGKTITDTKFYKKATRYKSIGLWISKETDHKYKESKKLLEQNNITTINPVYGDFVISSSLKIMNTFFADAMELGVSPVDYAKEKLDVMLEAYSSDMRHKKNISSVIKLRDKTMKTIDLHLIDKIKYASEK